MSAYEAGVAIYAGTDAGGVLPHGGIAGEVLELAAYGFSAEDALGAASWRAREWLGWNATLDEGAPADFVVLDRNPLEDLSVLDAAGSALRGPWWPAGGRQTVHGRGGGRRDVRPRAHRAGGRANRLRHPWRRAAQYVRPSARSRAPERSGAGRSDTSSPARGHARRGECSVMRSESPGLATRAVAGRRPAGGRTAARGHAVRELHAGDDQDDETDRAEQHRRQDGREDPADEGPEVRGRTDLGRPAGRRTDHPQLARARVEPPVADPLAAAAGLREAAGDGGVGDLAAGRAVDDRAVRGVVRRGPTASGRRRCRPSTGAAARRPGSSRRSPGSPGASRRTSRSRSRAPRG